MKSYTNQSKKCYLKFEWAVKNIMTQIIISNNFLNN